MQVTLPSTYDISGNLTTDYVPMPLIATNDADNKKLKFEHVGGLLQVNLNVPAGVKIATLSMGKTITGTFDLAAGSGNGVIEAGSVSDDVLTFILSEDGLAAETEVKLLAPLPSGTYEQFEVAYDNGFAFTKDLSSSPWTFDRTYGKKVSIAEDKFTCPDYFWFEALEPGSTVSFSPLVSGYSSTRNLYYSFDRSSFKPYYSDTETIVLENIGDRVWFYSDSEDSPCAVSNTMNRALTIDGVYTQIPIKSGGKFSGTGNLKCGGELRYLYRKGEEDVLPVSCFYGLFSGMTSLSDASELIFPDQTSVLCYSLMFNSCTNLTEVPEILPALSLSHCCYEKMFSYCTKLTKGPDLPAIDCAISCYDNMFAGSGIVNAPNISAKHTASYCFNRMFNDCSQLVEGPVFHIEDLSDNCFNAAFSKCVNLETSPYLPSISELAEWCYMQMFYNCPKLKNILFDLPATTIPYYAYEGMFQKCSELVEVPTFPSVMESVASKGMSSMFEDCISLESAIVPETRTSGGDLSRMYYGCKNLKSAEVYTLSSAGLGACFMTCTSLSSITVHFTEWPGGTTNWVKSVSSSGSFYKPSSLEAKFGTGYIPSGWTVYNLEEVEAGN